MRHRVALRVVVVAAALGLASPADAQEIPHDESGFTEYVASRLRAEVGDSDVTIKGPLTLKLGPLQANLDRIFSYCRRNAPGCGPEIATYVRGAVETYRAVSAPISRDAIRLVVRSREFVAQVQNSMGSTVPPLLQSAFVGGLVLLPVLDSPRTFRFLNRGDLSKLALSEPELQQLAVSNLRTALEAKPLMQIAKVVGRGEIGSLPADSLNPSRLALPDTWAPLAEAQGGTLIVVAPATDSVLYIAEDSADAIRALRTLADKDLASAPHPLSAELLRWTSRGWETVN